MWLSGAVLGAPALFLAGAAGSTHCALMCGCLAVHQARSTAGRLPAGQSVLWTQAGRVLGYGLMGTAAGDLGQSLLNHLPGASSGRILQGAAALAVVAVGMWLAFWRTTTHPRLCTGMQAPVRLQHWPVQLQLFAGGMLWAALPCALLYAVLFLCALSGTAVSGALLAGAFALGGAPLLTAIGWSGARRASSLPGLRAAGLWLIVLGLAGFAAACFLDPGSGPQWCGPLR